MSVSLETDQKQEVLEDDKVDHPWRVVLYNDDIHTFDEVIFQLIKATSCSFSKASEITITVHTEGKAVAFEGKFEQCFKVDNILKEIELITEIKG
jgi:ATP-dependent Clp protease adapter protein ClpS